MTKNKGLYADTNWFSPRTAHCRLRLATTCAQRAASFRVSLNANISRRGGGGREGCEINRAISTALRVFFSRPTIRVDFDSTFDRLALLFTHRDVCLRRRSAAARQMPLIRQTLSIADSSSRPFGLLRIKSAFRDVEKCKQ